LTPTDEERGGEADDEDRKIVVADVEIVPVKNGSSREVRFSGMTLADYAPRR
jgi:hypothetical protein